MDDEENGLFNIQISDASDDEEREAKEARRTGQSEDAWSAVQRDYQAKVENGDVSLQPSPVYLVNISDV